MKEEVYNSIFKSWVSPFTTYFNKPPPDMDSPLKMKKMPTPLKKFFKNQKVPST